MPTPRESTLLFSGRLNLTEISQKRFKKIVELGGFGLVHGAVVQPGGSGVAPSTPAKAKAESKKPAATPTPSKKRKRNATTPYKEEDEDEGVKQEVGAEQKE